MTNEGHVPAQDPVARERKELSGRLRMLREAAGKSQREFAGILGVDHSTVSIYEKPDGRVPDLEYIDGFLAEIQSRTDVTADVRKDTRDSYGRLLGLLCDRPQERGRTHGYRQLLRVYELTLELEALNIELADVRQQQQDVTAELARLQEAGAEAAANSERQLRLEESAEALEKSRAELARRREAVVFDLDAHSMQRSQFPPSDTPVSSPVGGPPQQPLGTRTRSRRILITAAFLCGALASALAFYVPNHYPFAEESSVYQLGSDCKELPLLCLYTKDTWEGGGIALAPGGEIDSLREYGLDNQISSWSNAVSGVTCYWYPDDNFKGKEHDMSGDGVNLEDHPGEDNSLSSVRCDSKK
ncbi:helix-turn-helix domain-containing protein [Streptomyces sp. NBC_00846]|uniref:helix-turn-helix domain-containing protein n=1 Tax=Streptomyces sp. NBC_00846 TaxID=2975849 RepID=UPI0038645A9D|nr:helix-turn-helix domain-containing protein [Streptomyces sp. NBC_00846]